MDVLQLASTYPTPFYVLDEVTLRRAAREFAAAFRRLWPNTQVAYPYKTNPLLALCQIMREEGMWAEVTSGDELRNALKLNVPTSRIIFNGPYKTRDELEFAIRERLILNVDGWEELAKVEELAKSLGLKTSVGLRLSTGYLDGADSKFGFSLRSREAALAVDKVVMSDALSLGGIHFHLGTNINGPEHYQRAITESRAVLERHRPPASEGIRYIDIGGGFAVQANRPDEIPAADWGVPSVSDLAGSVCETLGRSFPGETLLLVEPGRALVADSMSFVTRVVGVKSREGRLLCITDGGYNLIPSAYGLAHPVEVLPVGGRSSDTTRAGSTQVELYGPLCMSKDLVAAFVAAAPPRVGDLVVFGSVGAYNYSESFSFSRGRPPVILLCSDGSTAVCVREREPYDALQHLEHLL